MKNGIFISIRGEHTDRIERLIKNYEFRNYIPKRSIDYLIVYETLPSSCIKYIIELGDIIKYPNKIDEDGYGNREFNKGLKTKYAYQIKHLYKLKEFINLDILKNKYKFTPPQGYAYFDKYIDLYEDVFNMEMEKIF